MTWLTRLLSLFQPTGQSAALAAPAVAAQAAIPVLAVGDPPAPSLAALCRAAGFADPAGWAAALALPMRTYGIQGRKPVSAFLATVAHETWGGTRLVESLDYSAAGLMGTWPARFPPDLAHRLGRFAGQAADQHGIAERAYGDRLGNGPEGDGDGWRFRGRGGIHITGRAGYAAAATALAVPLGDLPAWLETRVGAATSAAWWWSANGCNALADAGHVEAWRRRVNGGLNGLADVGRRYADVMAV